MTDHENPATEAIGPPPDPMASSVSAATPSDPVVDYGDGLPPEGLWIKEGVNRVLGTIYAYKDPATGRLRSLSLFPQDLLRELGMVEYPIESEWSIPTRSEMEGYRDRSTRVDGGRGGGTVSRPLLQAHLIRYHLIAIRFRQSDGTMSPLELSRDKKGALDKEAFKVLGQLHPTVMDMLYSKFIDESALVI